MEDLASKKITLRYFDIRGKGEPIRLLFEEAGIKYEDVRFKKEEWLSSIKAEYIAKGIAPFGQVPVVSVGDDLHLPQMASILRLFAKQHNLYGSDHRTQYICDMIADGAEDWRQAYVRLVYGPKEDFETQKPKYLAGDSKKFLEMFETLLKRANGGSAYFAGEQLTFGDLLVWEMLDLTLRLDPAALQPYPLLAAFHSRVAERPRIKAYLASGRRPVQANNSQLG